MKIHKPSSKFRRTGGFTLLEMVIVLGIIAMITGGAIYSMQKIGNAAKLSQVETDFKSFQSALSMYSLNAGSFPTTQQGLKALNERPTTSPLPRRWVAVMDKIPNDPWGTPYHYNFPGKKNPANYEIISIGPDAQEGTQDDLSSQDL